jgi:hypothetical protein
MLGKRGAEKNLDSKLMEATQIKELETIKGMRKGNEYIKDTSEQEAILWVKDETFHYPTDINTCTTGKQRDDTW